MTAIILTLLLCRSERLNEIKRACTAEITHSLTRRCISASGYLNQFVVRRVTLHISEGMYARVHAAARDCVATRMIAILRPDPAGGLKSGLREILFFRRKNERSQPGLLGDDRRSCDASRERGRKGSFLASLERTQSAPFLASLSFCLSVPRCYRVHAQHLSPSLRS